jgi:hypothetical protein
MHSSIDKMVVGQKPFYYTKRKKGHLRMCKRVKIMSQMVIKYLRITEGVKNIFSQQVIFKPRIS